MEGRKNVVTVELNDDLRDKVSSLSTIIVGMKQTFLSSLQIDQVKKVVRNRSKNDIALVLQSCEHLDNVVDSAIAKLIGPGIIINSFIIIIIVIYTILEHIYYVYL